MLALTTLPASVGFADEGLLRTEFPSAEDPGIPAYARINDFPPHVLHDGEWAAIYFYRDPSCVPADFNLLTFFDFGAFGCPLEVKGFDLWEAEPLSTPPKIIISRGTGAVPVWFVPVGVVDQAMQDGELTIGELAGLEGLLAGSADQFNETHHVLPSPPLGGGGHPNPKIITNAHGQLEDGRRFNLHITWLIGEFHVVRIQFR
ncbi:MAG TPA: hypothetical protein VFZ41_08385 [Solirubrobacterales bacterium]